MLWSVVYYNNEFIIIIIGCVFWHMYMYVVSNANYCGLNVPVFLRGCLLGVVVVIAFDSLIFVIAYWPHGPQWSSFDRSILLLILWLQYSIFHLPIGLGKSFGMNFDRMLIMRFMVLHNNSMWSLTFLIFIFVVLGIFYYSILEENEHRKSLTRCYIDYQARTIQWITNFILVNTICIKNDYTFSTHNNKIYVLF